MVIVGLIEENIFAIRAVGGKIFQHARWGDSMLQAEPLPELKAN
jgi:hypothetical protein